MAVCGVSLTLRARKAASTDRPQTLRDASKPLEEPLENKPGRIVQSSTSTKAEIRAAARSAATCQDRYSRPVGETYGGNCRVVSVIVILSCRSTRLHNLTTASRRASCPEPEDDPRPTTRKHPHRA